MTGSIVGPRPVTFLDILLAPLLRLIWEPLSMKRSHWFNWEKAAASHTLRELKGYCLIVPGNGWAHGWRTPFGRFWQLNFGWKRVAIVRLKSHYDRESYQIGFIPPSGIPEVCSLVVTGSVALLIGPEATNFFARDPHSLGMRELEFVGEAEKQKLPKGIPLL